MGWLAPRLGRFTPGKTWYPLYKKLGGPLGRSGRVRKISPVPGFDPRTVQPVASRYTEYSIKTLCSLVDIYVRFGGTYCLPLHGQCLPPKCLDAFSKLHCSLRSESLLLRTFAERTRVPAGVLILCSWNCTDTNVITAWCTMLAPLPSLASGLLASLALRWLQWGIRTILHIFQTTTSPTPAAWLSLSGCTTLCITCATGNYGDLFYACSRKMYLHTRACAHTIFHDFKPVVLDF
jgi:hypothetical protein